MTVDTSSLYDPAGVVGRAIGEHQSVLRPAEES